MFKKKKRIQQEEIQNKQENIGLFKKNTIKELIAPSGIDASNMDYLKNCIKCK